ncbi:MAG: hypothetical protein AAFX04_12280 [Pseudomonadota bacterium]
MQSFSPSEAWAETVRLTKEHWLALAGLMLLLFAILGIIGSVFFAGAFATLFDLSAMSDPARFEEMMAASSGAVVLGNILFNAVFVAITMACFRYAATDGAAGFGDALKFGVVSAVPVLLAMLVIGIVLVILFFIAALILGVIGFAGIMASDGGGGGGALALGVLTIFLIYPAFIGLGLFMLARFGMAGPLMAAAGSYNPFSAIGAAWSLSRGHTWRLMAYYFVGYLGILVLMFLAGAVIAIAMQAAEFLLVLFVPLYLVVLLVQTMFPVAAFRVLDGGRHNAEEMASIFD